MIEIESRVVHQLGRVSAIKKLREFVGSLPQRFPEQVHQVSMKMHEDSVEVQFAAYGYMVQWRALVEESSIVLQGSIPDSARRFQNKMLQTVVDRISEAMRPMMSVPLRRVA
jgi:hypothetical protein